MRGDEYTGQSYELNADLAQLAAQQQSANQAPVDAGIPVSGFVATINSQTGNVDINGGTFDGVTFTFTGGAGAVALTVTGLGALANIKTNFSAAVAPTVNDDSGDGYTVGSQWIDTVLDDAYICCDATVAAAIWKKTTP